MAALAVAIVAVLAAAGYAADQMAPGGLSQAQPVVHPSKSAAPAPSASAAAARQPIGRSGLYTVAQRWYVFAEHPAEGDAPRILRVIVRSPVAAANSPRGARGLFPLVVFAPGYRQCAAPYRSLLQHWASAGYVVAAVQFPLTNCHVAQPDESDLTNEPADVAFVIRRLLSLSGHRQGQLAGLIDASRIAVAGHSDGGDLAAALAAAGCCHNKVVRAAIVLAGARWPAFNGPWFARGTPPMIFVQGTADTWNPPETNMELYEADANGVRYYLDLFGAGHFSPYEGSRADEPEVARVTLDFLDAYLAGQPTRLTDMRNAAQVRGVSVLVSGGAMP